MSLSLPSDEGLSPRARGNRRAAADPSASSRPIPAGAGQPDSSDSIRPSSGAYPRGRGATARDHRHDLDRPGLSPRARGNRARQDALAAKLRPIPAGAGQPTQGSCQRSAAGAYPRGRGATRASFVTTERLHGLSPRARGNPTAMRGKTYPNRPIPAGAGQPCRGPSTDTSHRAYPRGRGATYQSLFGATGG